MQEQGKQKGRTAKNINDNMAFHLSSIALYPNPQILICKPKKELKINTCRTNAQSEGTQGGITDEESSTSSEPQSSARTQLDLLEQLTASSSSNVNGYESDDYSQKPSIREQLARLAGDRDDDFDIPLGKNLKKFTPKFLTVSQKRNIKRQTYLNEVSKRNDSVFFATIGGFVILPPIIILAFAILTGYVQLFP